MSRQITGRHYEVSDPEKDYLEKKMRRFHRLFDRIDETSFTITKEKLSYTAEASFHAGTIHVVTKSSDAQVKAAIDKAIDKLENRIVRSKKRRSGRKKNGPALKSLRPQQPSDE